MGRERDNDREKIEPAPPCVWMTAGLLAWRLCDRELDCEHCPLDAALRSPASVRPPSGPRWDYPDDRLYHPGHTWVRQTTPARMRCGVDAFVARLFAHVRGVVLPAQESLLVHGQIGCWLEDGDELIPLRAPATGTVLARNAALQCEAGLLVADPYGAGWLFELAGKLSPATAPTVRGAAEAEAEALRQIARLERRAARTLVQGRRRVGATAADGGEPLSDLRRILGAERYRRLTRPFVG